MNTASTAGTSSSEDTNSSVSAGSIAGLPQLKVAVITGSNTGIGFAIVEALCKKPYGHVYLTSRTLSKGIAAVCDLKEMNLFPRFHQLDIRDDFSIKELKNTIESEHGGIDLLINNAAEYFPEDSEVDELTQIEEIMYTNYFGTLAMCEAFIPLLRKNGRIVNVICAIGSLLSIPGQKVRLNFMNSKLTIDTLNDLIHTYLSDISHPQQEKYWGRSAFAVSKVGVGALTVIYQRMFDRLMPEKNLSINSVHPGYCRTPKTDYAGSQSIEEGAEVPLYLALENHGLKGQFLWHTKEEVNWFVGPVPDL